jgi:hypothetical protein
LLPTTGANGFPTVVAPGCGSPWLWVALVVGRPWGAQGK